VTRAWRLVKRKRVATAFSGEGARLAGGRWNHAGTSVVYLSGTLSLAALELFVHLDSRSRTSLELASIPVTIPDDLVEVFDKLPRRWRSEPSPKETKDLGTAWASSGSSCVLRVPSAIIPEEFNYVVNPAHADFGMIVAGEPERFSLDPRLWK
jgi:RES domain-containing protein